jgi:predicted GIY-YIG superfamily endonuclease
MAKKRSRTEYIYTLLDGSNHIFYVGRSASIERRLREHLDESIGGGTSKKCEHIRYLIAVGEQITIKQIDEAPAEEIEELEAWWIDRLWMSQQDDGYIIDLKNGNGGAKAT